MRSTLSMDSGTYCIPTSSLPNPIQPYPTLPNPTQPYPTLPNPNHALHGPWLEPDVRYKSWGAKALSPMCEPRVASPTCSLAGHILSVSGRELVMTCIVNKWRNIFVLTCITKNKDIFLIHFTKLYFIVFNLSRDNLISTHTYKQWHQIHNYIHIIYRYIGWTCHAWLAHRT